MRILMILIVFITIFNITSCKKPQPEVMIKQFVIDLFDDEMAPQKVVNTYLEIKPDNKNSLSLSERKKGAIGIIEKARNGESKEFGWLVPNYEIKNIKNPKVYPYQDFKNLDKLEISTNKIYKENIYVLLDSKKENILQYFYLNKNNDKIISFNLFVKSDLVWFFEY